MPSTAAPVSANVNDSDQPRRSRAFDNVIGVADHALLLFRYIHFRKKECTMSIAYLNPRARPTASVEPYLSTYYRAVERAHAEEAMFLGQLVLRAGRILRALLGRTRRLSAVS
jgi:hypothetical protein